MEFMPELLEKAKKAESAEALQALAKENHYDMSAEEANAYFAQMHKSGELNDEELENVSGGGCRNNGHLVVTGLNSCDMWICKKDKIAAELTGWRSYNASEPEKRCPKCGLAKVCTNCDYCRYERALWLCYNPKK